MGPPAVRLPDSVFHLRRKLRGDANIGVSPPNHVWIFRYGCNEGLHLRLENPQAGKVEAVTIHAD